MQLYKIFAILVCVCCAWMAQAEVDVQTFTVDDDWPIDHLLVPGDFACPGGEVYITPEGTPACDGGKGMHIRNTEMYSCVGNSQPSDDRLEGTMWFSINANFDQEYTGPIFGKFRMVPSVGCNTAHLVNPDVYWEGSWQGTRELVGIDPPTWVGVFNVVGQGVGGELAGLQFRATEEIITFTPVPLAWDLLPIGVTGPEGQVLIEISGQVDK